MRRSERDLRGQPCRCACTVGALALSGLLSWLAPAAAFAEGPKAPSAEGLGPDAQLTGGVGFGLDGSLDNYFLGRGRLGILYAREPWIVNAGVSFDAGALGRLGIGAELELNAWQGWFLDLGVSRVQGGEWMSHVSAGFTVVGVEWQHRFEGKAPNHALLIEVRLPIGLWWFFVGRKNDERSIAEIRARADAAQPAPPAAAMAMRPKAPEIAPPSPVPAQPSAAGASLAQAGTRSSSAQSKPDDVLPSAVVAPSGPSPAERKQLDEALRESQTKLSAGDYLGAIVALQRAWDIFPEPGILLQLAEVEQAHGALVPAAETLRKFLSHARSDAALAMKPEAQARLQAIQARIPQLRVELSGAHGDELVELDGKIERGATLGYDVPVDPGQHRLIIVRAGKPLTERVFQAQESKLIRLSIDVSQPPPP